MARNSLSSMVSIDSSGQREKLPTLLDSPLNLSPLNAAVSKAVAKFKRASNDRNLGSLGVLFKAKVKREGDLGNVKKDAEKEDKEIKEIKELVHSRARRLAVVDNVAVIDAKEIKERPRRNSRRPSLPIFDAADDEHPGLLRGKVMLKTFGFFKKLPARIQTNLLSVVHYASRSAGSVLFEQGDPPNECYIILHGSVGIHIKTAEDNETEVSDKAEESNEEEEEVDKDDPAVKYGKQVALLGTGSLFGEVAIIKGLPRNATCACVEDTEFLYIGSADFERVLKKDMEAFKDDKIAWLENHIPGAKTIKDHRMELVAFNFRVASYPKGHVFIQQGARTDERVYLIRKGCVEVRCQKFGNLVANKLSVLVEGGLFGSAACNSADPICCKEPYSYIVSKVPCEVLEATRGNFARLPLSVRVAVHDQLSRSTRWHEEARTIDSGTTFRGIPLAKLRQESRAIDTSATFRGTSFANPCHRRLQEKPSSIVLRDYVALPRNMQELDYLAYPDMIPLAAVGTKPFIKRATSLPALAESVSSKNIKSRIRRDQSISHRSLSMTACTRSHTTSCHNLSTWSLDDLSVSSSLDDFIKSRGNAKKETMTMTTMMNSMQLPATSITVPLNSTSLLPVSWY